ncbi:SCO1860 family LAETG-anchored protein [Streptomyces thermoalcalitolerans]|uniref:SCO1860 family LAETG-anchored protein n=1 Tax=Streptomyces thermoalcalitolerans TaxID=65605 RepID=A0ABP3YVT2_9ACTN
MNGHTFRMPARRCVTVAAATALAAGPVVLAGASSAHATGAQNGRAGASVLRTDLDVSLLNKAVQVPLAVSLNEVRAPQSAEQTTLTARLDGVNGGKPFHVLRADVAKSGATVSADKAEGTAELVRAKVHVPGLPLLSVIEVGQVTSRATCEAGKAPAAASNVLGPVKVLGKRVTLTSGGTTDVHVPNVGKVRLDLSKRETTSATAAATALELKVSVDPLKLNVAKVEGTLTLARATCESPAAPEDPGTAAEEPAAPSDKSAAPSDKSAAPSDKSGEPSEKSAAPEESEAPEKSAASPAGDVKAQGAPASEANLAETGSSSLTPYLAGGSAVLLALGGGAVALARRRKKS